MSCFKPSAALTAVAIAVVLGACGSGGSSSSDVNAGQYVKSICTAVGPFEKDVVRRSNALNSSTLSDASQGKRALQDFLSGVAADADRVLSQIKSAGAPKVSNGKSVAAAIVNAFTQLKSTMTQAAGQAASIPTNTAAAFRSGAAALGSTLRSSMSSIGTSLKGLRNADLEKAASKEPACRSLGA